MARILIVDDEKSIRITFTRFLTKEGHKVTTAEDVETALELIKKEIPDLIVTDIIMPKTSGIDLLKKIGKSNPDILVIIMTGEPSLETATDALRMQANDYMQKPVNKNTLLATVERALNYKSVLDKKNKLEKENEEYRNNLETLVKSRTVKLEKTIRATIETISSLLEIRDPYTAGHERRVGNLAMLIGKQLNLDKNVLAGLCIAGYLHDIGKISVPSEILSKPGKLTELEYEIIKTHVVYSYDILKSLDLPWPIAEIIRNHHERLDGSGYPRGIGQDEIGLESRILMVSDVVEAMMSHRPYRPALEQAVVIEELNSGKGKKYDDKIVTVVLGIITRSDFILDNSSLNIEFSL